jgi:hypothetical protein
MSKVKVNTVVGVNVVPITEKVIGTTLPELSPGSMEAPEDNLTISTEKLNISSAEYAPESLVKFFVEYAKGYDGPKHMEEGSTHEVHTSAADYFISKCMGKVIK